MYMNHKGVPFMIHIHRWKNAHLAVGAELEQLPRALPSSFQDGPGHYSLAYGDVLEYCHRFGAP